MKKIYLFIVALLPLLLCVSVLRAQDPNFSQFYFKELYYNPAFTGVNPGLRGTISDRHLWVNVPGEYGTQSIAFDYYDDKFAQGGFGAHMTRNTQGQNFLNTFNGGLTYAKQIRILPDFMIQIGAGAQYVYKTIDYGGLTFTDQYDPRFGAIYETEFVAPEDGVGSKGAFDYSAGMIVRFNIRETPVKYIAANTFGIAFHHLSEPDFSWLDDGNEAPLPMKMVIHGYSMVRINRSGFHNRFFLLTPGFLYENQAESQYLFKGEEAGAKTLSFGLNAVIPSKISFVSSLYIGAWMRKQYWKREQLADYIEDIKKKSFDSMIFTLGYIKYSKNKNNKELYRFLYNYDMTISAAGLSTGGSHEVTLSFEIHDLALPGRNARKSAVPHPNDKFFK
ncbi:MAG: PorP/SprF family type IX secretion system membrane protein [Bacteroidales bacterium]|nr:PorP/SprF family type IX secretion system membrane protein [Bacteroidales bacterium]